MGGGPVMMREGSTLVMRSAPTVVMLAVAPAPVPQSQATPMFDLDFDVGCLRATRS